MSASVVPLAAATIARARPLLLQLRRRRRRRLAGDNDRWNLLRAAGDCRPQLQNITGRAHWGAASKTNALFGSMSRVPKGRLPNGGQRTVPARTRYCGQERQRFADGGGRRNAVLDRFAASCMRLLLQDLHMARWHRFGRESAAMAGLGVVDNTWKPAPGRGPDQSSLRSAGGGRRKTGRAWPRPKVRRRQGIRCPGR